MPQPPDVKEVPAWVAYTLGKSEAPAFNPSTVQAYPLTPYAIAK